MHNINHKWSMAVFESILFHVFLIAFLVAAGSFFMASLPESSPIEVDLVDTTAGASGGAGSGSGHGSSVSKSDTVNVNQLPGGESKDSSAVSSDMASYEVFTKHKYQHRRIRRCRWQCPGIWLRKWDWFRLWRWYWDWLRKRDRLRLW